MSNSGVRPYQPLTSRYGSTGQFGEWQQAVDAYYWDKMEDAYAIAQSLGTGPGAGFLNWLRMIEGEALTRESSIVQKPAPWLSLEYAPHELTLDQRAVDTIVQACTSVAGKLQWNFEMAVWVTVLLDEIDAPWHGARFGYCVDKYPYDKICIPHRAAASHDSLERVISHEFTHVITLNLTRGRIPHWLDEGLAMLMEGSKPLLGPRWMEPNELNAAFERDRRVDEGLEVASEAYSQGAFLVRYLYSIGGEAKLSRLLRAFVDHGTWAEVKINLLGEPSVEEALHDVYGFSQHELFSRANRWRGDPKH